MYQGTLLMFKEKYEDPAAITVLCGTVPSVVDQVDTYRTNTKKLASSKTLPSVGTVRYGSKKNTGTGT
jgi:hypothetical protein